MCKVVCYYMHNGLIIQMLYDLIAVSVKYDNIVLEDGILKERLRETERQLQEKKDELVRMQQTNSSSFIQESSLHLQICTLEKKLSSVRTSS